MIAPAFAAALLLGILVQGWWRGRGIAARVAALAGAGRRRGLYGWALGTWATFALPAFAALILLGRVRAVATIPPELEMLAWDWGLPAAIGPNLPWTLGALGLGAAIGIAILLVRRALGKPPIGLRYRSPAAIRSRGDTGGAAAIAVAAGIGEELFFRLALPLSVGLLTGSTVAGVVVATIAFGLAHRHQGWVGIVLTGVVGAGLFWLYLWSGALWIAMAAHVAIDLHALILRPWITGKLSS